MENFEINFTIFIQLANFLITLFVLNYMLIKPIRQQIQKRKDTTDSYSNVAQHFIQLADEKLSQYEQALNLTRQKAAIERDNMKTQEQSNGQNILTKAQADTNLFLKESRQELIREVQVIKDSLSKQIPAFATQAVAKILG